METFGRNLIQKIKDAELSGENAHQIYSPPYRPLFTYNEILTRNPKFAAVNILLYLKNNEWYFPLIVRSTNKNDQHSGQISLPGGKKETTDKNFMETAIRETNEEMGIDKQYIRIIREISPIYIPPSNFFVHAFISYTKKNPIFSLQQTEAVQLIEFPVTSLLDLPENPKMQVLPSSRGVEVPVIIFENFLIWGATSMILSELSYLLKKL